MKLFEEYYPWFVLAFDNVGGHFEIVNVVNYEGKGSDVRVYLKCDECGEEISIPYFLVK